MNNINKFNKIQFKKILSNKFKHNMDNNKNIKNIIIIKEEFKLRLKVISKKKMPLTMLGLVNMLIILLMSKMMKKIKFI